MTTAAKSTTVLAGDIGGTHTRLALFHADGGELQLTAEKVYPSREYAGLEEIAIDFLRGQNTTVSAACFGIAGPVVNGKAKVSNLPWTVDASAMAQSLRVANVGSINVSLINDLAAHASGIDALRESDFVTLNAGQAGEGNGALIAAGTGLGEAGLFWDGKQRLPFACEGGHADFAPTSELEVRLYQYLATKFGHVSCERVLSGPGLKNIYDFLRDSGVEQEPAWLRDELAIHEDASALISQYALAAKADICVHSLDMFVAIYGSEAGNVALRFLATAGVYVSGGIAGKILGKLQSPAFLQAFVAKGRMQPLLEQIPVKVIVNDKVGLLGAARCALRPQAL